MNPLNQPYETWTAIDPQLLTLALNPMEVLARQYNIIAEQLPPQALRPSLTLVLSWDMQPVVESVEQEVEQEIYDVGPEKRRRRK